MLRVAEVVDENVAGVAADLPLHLLPAKAGDIAVQLRTTAAQVVLGSSVARDAGQVQAVRAAAGATPVVLSPIAGTIVLGGEGWLSLCAIGHRDLDSSTPPLDWMLGSVREWLDEMLSPWGAVTAVGRIDGAWCPGFSDIGVADRKLAGVGFRVTRDAVIARAVLAVRTVSDADYALLERCHDVIGVTMARRTLTSLEEISGDPGVNVARAVRWAQGYPL